MRPPPPVCTALLFALALSPAAPVAHAADKAGWQHPGVWRIADQQPLGAVLQAIGQRYPGRALDARRIERDGRALYQIKWLGDDGKVRDITADARTGEILSVR